MAGTDPDGVGELGTERPSASRRARMAVTRRSFDADHEARGLVRAARRTPVARPGPAPEGGVLEKVEGPAPRRGHPPGLPPAGGGNAAVICGIGSDALRPSWERKVALG